MLRASCFLALVALAAIGAKGSTRPVSSQTEKAASSAPIPACPCSGTQSNGVSGGQSTGSAVAGATVSSITPRVCPQWFLGEFDGVLYYEAAYYYECPSTYFEPTFMTGPHDCPCDCDDIGPLQCELVAELVESESRKPISIPKNGDVKNLVRSNPKWQAHETQLQSKLVRLDHDGDAATPEKVIRTYVFAVDPTFGVPSTDGRTQQARLAAIGFEVAGADPTGLELASSPSMLSPQRGSMSVGPVRYAILLEAPQQAQ